MTPSEMVAKYGVGDPDVKKRINDISNGVSYTASNRNISFFDFLNLLNISYYYIYYLFKFIYLCSVYYMFLFKFYIYKYETNKT